MTFFGIATADNRPRDPEGMQGDIPIYEWPNNFGFLIVVEGRPGQAGASIGSGGTMGVEAAFPDLQILADRALGDGSTTVCDVGPAPEMPLGGVPGVSPPDFDAGSDFVDNAMRDMACRFDVHDTDATACTVNDLGNFAFATPDPARRTRQFCSVPAVGAELAFPSGDTLLTVRLRDTAGNTGPPAQLILRAP